MTPEELTSIREQVTPLGPRDFEFSSHWELAISAKELLMEVDRLRAELATAKADALREAAEVFKLDPGYAGSVDYALGISEARRYLLARARQHEEATQ